MSDVYTPNPANHPTSITLPQDGDLKAAASVRVALAALADMIGSNGFLGSGSLAEMELLSVGQVGSVPGFAGSTFYVSGHGLYSFSTAGGLPANDTVNFMIVDGVGGKWLRHDYQAVTNKLKAIVGPSTGVTFPTATPAGRINKELIHQGWFANDGSDSYAAYTTTSTSIVTLGPSPLCNLGNTLDGGCIIRFTLNGTVVVTGGSPLNFNVSTEISLDNGGSWIAVTGNGGTLVYRSPTDNIIQAVSLGFMKITSPAPTGNVLIRLRGFLLTAGSMTLNVESWEAWVTRA